MQLPIIISLLSFSLYSLSSLALARPAAPVPTSLVPNNNHITGNFSHSCEQITLMNKYFLAATCSPIIIEPGSGSDSGSGSGPGSGEGEGENDGKQHEHVPPAPEFRNQLDLNMCIGFDQGTAGGPESSGGGAGVYGRLIWQAL
ncbi:hypothetical protein N0V85_002916 [Neurospora sp. IMI 360204]|nr:hypothetical protein N0V85_002916 [Neurospora sp. IMI 360204]